MRIEFNPKMIRQVLWALSDIVIILFSAILSTLVHFELRVPTEYATRILYAMLWVIPIYITVYIAMGHYLVLWRYAGGYSYLRLGFASAVAGLVSIAINYSLQLTLSNSILLLTSVFSFGLIGIVRFSWRYISNFRQKIAGPKLPQSNVLIVGAGAAAAWVIAQYDERNRNVKPVAIVDDALDKQGLKIRGVPVVGIIADVPKLVEAYGIDEIIIAIPSLKNRRFADIVALCAATRLPVRTVSEPKTVDAGGKLKPPVMRKLNTSDFLSRREVELDTESISKYLTGNVIMVTGGGGSIGSEICRQVMRFSPERLIVFDSYENGANELYQELAQKLGPKIPVEICIGSIRDPARLDDVLKRYRPTVVFHAAAHKHVPLMEAAPLEAIKNNIFGTRNVLVASEQNGVERFVILSTDKAVNPTNVMGATKRVAEMLIQSYAPKSTMKCMAVRFGNVLGSHGSVIPLFTQQIESGGPVTLTHPDMKRYFMTIPEAAQLVLQAGGLAQDGAIYVLDMGKPIRIFDLAVQLIRAYGHEPNDDIKIEVTGLRPGEKLYEELMTKEESMRMEKTAHDLIFVAPPIPMDIQAFWNDLDKLERIEEQEGEKAVQMLERMVVTFKRSKRIA